MAITYLITSPFIEEIMPEEKWRDERGQVGNEANAKTQK